MAANAAAKVDPFREKKRGHRPQLVQRQYEREHPPKFRSQFLVIEGHRRDQITAQRNTDARRHQCCYKDSARFPPRQKRTQHPLDSGQAKQCDHVEGQIHQLNQTEQAASQTATGQGHADFRMKTAPAGPQCRTPAVASGKSCTGDFAPARCTGASSRYPRRATVST